MLATYLIYTEVFIITILLMSYSVRYIDAFCKKYPKLTQIISSVLFCVILSAPLYLLGYACYEVLTSSEWWCIFPILIVMSPLFLVGYVGVKYCFNKIKSKLVRG